MTDRSKNQGEGNKDAARRYNRETEEFVESGKVDKAAEQAGDDDQAGLDEAEEEGKDRAREFDPNVKRDYTHGS